VEVLGASNSGSMEPGSSCSECGQEESGNNYRTAGWETGTRAKARATCVRPVLGYQQESNSTCFPHSPQHVPHAALLRSMMAMLREYAPAVGAGNKQLLHAGRG